MADDFVDFTSYFFHCAGPEEGNVVSEAPLSRIGEYSADNDPFGATPNL